MPAINGGGEAAVDYRNDEGDRINHYISHRAINRARQYIYIYSFDPSFGPFTLESCLRSLFSVQELETECDPVIGWSVVCESVVHKSVGSRSPIIAALDPALLF